MTMRDLYFPVQIRPRLSYTRDCMESEIQKDVFCLTSLLSGRAMCMPSEDRRRSIVTKRFMAYLVGHDLSP